MKNLFLLFTLLHFISAQDFIQYCLRVTDCQPSDRTFEPLLHSQDINENGEWIEYFEPYEKLMSWYYQCDPNVIIFDNHLLNTIVPVNVTVNNINQYMGNLTLGGQINGTELHSYYIHESFILANDTTEIHYYLYRGVELVFDISTESKSTHLYIVNDNDDYDIAIMGTCRDCPNICLNGNNYTYIGVVATNLDLPAFDQILIGIVSQVEIFRDLFRGDLSKNSYHNTYCSIDINSSKSFIRTYEWYIIGISIGVFVLLVLSALLTCYCYLRRRKRSQYQSI